MSVHRRRLALLLGLLVVCAAALTHAAAPPIPANIPVVWQNTQLPAGVVFDTAIDPVQPRNWYVVATGVPFNYLYSRDAGATWSTAATWHGSMATNTVAIDPQQPNILYAGGQTETYTPAIFKSTDSGVTWDARSTGLGGTTPVSVILVHPSIAGLVFAGSGGGTPYVYRSDDGGMTWQTIALTGPNNAVVESLLVDPNNHQHILAIVLGQAIFESTDAGSTWAPTDLMILPSRTSALAFGGPDGHDLYQLACDLYKRPAGQQEWLKIASPVACYDHLMLDPNRPGVIYLAHRDMPLTRSLDDGATWAAMDATIDGQQINGSAAAMLDPGDTRHILAYTREQNLEGLFRSVYLSQQIYAPIIGR